MDFESNFSESLSQNRHEYYTRLCALFTSGELTEDEQSRLNSHLADCESCSRQLQSYCVVAKSGVALLAALHEPTVTEEFAATEPAKARIMERIAADKASRRPQLIPRRARGLLTQKIKAPALFATAAALAFVVATAGFSYRLGQTRGTKAVRAAPPITVASQQTGGVQSAGQRIPLEERLRMESREIQRLEQELKQEATRISESQSLQEKLQHESQQQSSTIAGLDFEKAALAAERDMLNRKLQESQTALEAAQQRLQNLQEEHNRQLLRTASLQAQLDDLSTSLKHAQDTARHEEGFLASDRDIRELMGARELYIADVFDIDREGKTRKPFGRVFYTGGKSLLFYAFDLDREPGVREASTFQVWGRRGPGDKRPLSMGILYEDSTANRRWVLRFDDFKALAEIDAVFVTVEPRGKAGQKPTGRQLLFASLRTPPNHP